MDRNVTTSQPLPPASVAPATAVRRSVLVADDSRAQRMMLRLVLLRWGYDVTEVASGEEAALACAERHFDIILSDWMMGGMSGLDLCRSLRRAAPDRYSYFILLSSKSEKAEVADGLEAGADDFLTKPVSAGELRARLRAGERILSMQAALMENNRLLGSALAELTELYESLDRELVAARAVQQTFMRQGQCAVPGADIAVLFRSSGHVGGDLVGWFAVNAHVLILYSIDVSGHGAASAMLSARLAGMLSASAPERNAALVLGSHAPCDTWLPEEVALRFNRLLLEEVRVEQYLTMVYAQVDLATGLGRLVQAGHPHPLVLRAGGGVDLLGDGGPPVGLLPDMTYEGVEFRLAPGDRLFLPTDGITECPAPCGTELGEEGLIRMIDASRHLTGQALLESLVWDLAAYHGSEDFPDDVSGLILDYRGLPARG